MLQRKLLQDSQAECDRWRAAERERMLAADTAQGDFSKIQQAFNSSKSSEASEHDDSGGPVNGGKSESMARCFIKTYIV